MVAAEVAAKPAADMADIGDMPRKIQIHKYTGMDLKQKYKLDPPGMEDMLIAVWATAACPEYIETGIPKLDESPDMPANTNTLTGRLESWNSMELDNWTFKEI